MKKLSNELGQSLLEITLSTSLVASMALGSMKMLSNTQKLAMDFEKTSDVVFIENQIASKLLSQGGCEQLKQYTLEGITPGTDFEIKKIVREFNPTTRRIESTFGQTLFAADMIYGKAKINKMEIASLTELESSLDSRTGIVGLKLEFATNIKGSSFLAEETKVFSKKLIVPVRLNSEGGVEDCNLNQAHLYQTIYDKVCSEELNNCVKFSFYRDRD